MSAPAPLSAVMPALRGCRALAAAALALLAAGQALPQKGLPPRVDAMSIPLVEEVAQPSYPEGSTERAVFGILNAVRAKGNFGLLAQDARLDAAAAAHASYLARNPGVGLTHRESADGPGFTGDTPMARARAVGFSPATSLEALSTGATVSTCLELLNTVYHLSMLTLGVTHVGIGVHARSGCVIDLHLPLRNRRMQVRGGGTVGVYPYPDQDDVPTTFLPDTETPRPPLDAGVREAGPPILVDLTSEDTGVLRASDIVISRFALTEAASAQPVAATVLASMGVASTADANLDHRADAAVVSSGHVFLVPTRPLKATTTYAVDFEGTVKGTTVGRRWRFTTR